MSAKNTQTTRTADKRTPLSFQQCADLVLSTGTTNTTLIEGESGIGKSAVAHAVWAKLDARHPGEYLFVNIDCTILDLGDVFVPWVDKEGHLPQTRFAPSARFRVVEAIESGKKLVINLDEIGKGNNAVINALLPLMLERRLAEVHLPEGSVVMATTNLAVESLGDRLMPHHYNRISTVRMRKPTHEEWAYWATRSGIAGEVVALVNQYPVMLADYDSPAGAENNPYICKPGTNARHFTSPRSLALASNIFHQASQYDMATFEAALQGTIGVAAAAEARAMKTVGDKLPTHDEVMLDPMRARLPDDPLTGVVWAFRAAAILSESCLVPYLKYASRLGAEHRALLVQFGLKQRPSLLAKIASSKSELGGVGMEFIKELAELQRMHYAR